jgi:hypothetical protein
MSAGLLAIGMAVLAACNSIEPRGNPWLELEGLRIGDSREKVRTLFVLDDCSPGLAGSEVEEWCYIDTNYEGYPAVTLIGFAEDQLLLVRVTVDDGDARQVAENLGKHGAPDRRTVYPERLWWIRGNSMLQLEMRLSGFEVWLFPRETDDP